MPDHRKVYEDPSSYLEFLTSGSDDKFESQHFERKEVGRNNIEVTPPELNNVRNGITKTVSAFANSNTEGGLLVLGIASDGTISGIDHLSESKKNSLTPSSSICSAIRRRVPPVPVLGFFFDGIRAFPSPPILAI